MLHLKVQKRDVKSEKAKNILKNGFVPGVVYGPKIVSTSVSIQYKNFNDIYEEAGETTLVALDDALNVSGSSEKTVAKEDNVVLIRDVQRHPVTGRFIHVDFYQLPLDQEIEIAVPVEGINEAPAVKEQGGVLVQNLHEIDIKALPKDLIHEITVDLSRLSNIDDTITVKDLIISDKVEVLADFEEVVFMVEAPQEEVVEEEPVIEGEQISEIATEGEEKRAEKEEAAAEEELAAG